MDTPKKHLQDEIIDRLYRLRYVGQFPGGYSVLLVSLDTATTEINYLFKMDLTSKQVKTFLKEEEIFIFNTPDDWFNFKTPKKEKR